MTMCECCEQDKPGKRGTCLDCKTAYPFVASKSMQKPFNRKDLWRADQVKKRKEIAQ